MRTLVLNGGSSSIKFSVYQAEGSVPQSAQRVVVDGQLSGIGSADAALQIAQSESSEYSSGDYEADARTLDLAVHAVLHAVTASIAADIDAVGYRVVHPGPNLHAHQRITPQVLEDLEPATDFAPLHDPEALLLIRATMRRFPNVAHYACFDTVFHQTMPEAAFTYPLPPAYGEHGVRRYGFHGLSCESIVQQLRAQGDLPRRMVIAHLGSGCSVTALVNGDSVDTTMGLTPTGGIVMGTRSGDLDPGLVLYLLRQQRGTRQEAAAAIEKLLNRQSGIASLSRMANDVKAVRIAANSGNQDALLALHVFTRSITKAIGGYCWLLGGLDAIVFTGGIGQHDPQTPADVLAGLAELGIQLEAANPHPPGQESILQISSSESATRVLIVPALEDRMIAQHVQRMATAAATEGTL